MMFVISAEEFDALVAEALDALPQPFAGKLDNVDVVVANLIVRRLPRPIRYPLGGWRLPAIRFEANDANWASGSGPAVTGPLEAIVMVLARRSQAVADLEGEGVAALRKELTPN